MKLADNLVSGLSNGIDGEGEVVFSNCDILVLHTGQVHGERKGIFEFKHLDVANDVDRRFFVNLVVVFVLMVVRRPVRYKEVRAREERGEFGRASNKNHGGAQGFVIACLFRVFGLWFDVV